MLFALAGAIGGSFLAKYAGGYELRASYGAFLIALGLVQMYKTVRAVVKEKKQKKRERERKSAPATANDA